MALENVIYCMHCRHCEAPRGISSVYYLVCAKRPNMRHRVPYDGFCHEAELPLEDAELSEEERLVQLGDNEYDKWVDEQMEKES